MKARTLTAAPRREWRNLAPTRAATTLTEATQAAVTRATVTRAARKSELGDPTRIARRYPGAGRWTSCRRLQVGGSAKQPASAYPRKRTRRSHGALASLRRRRNPGPAMRVRVRVRVLGPGGTEAAVARARVPREGRQQRQKGLERSRTARQETPGLRPRVVAGAVRRTRGAPPLPARRNAAPLKRP